MLVHPASAAPRHSAPPSLPSILSKPLYRWQWRGSPAAAMPAQGAAMHGAVFAANDVAARQMICRSLFKDAQPPLASVSQLTVQRCLWRPSTRQLRQILSPVCQQLAALLQAGVPLLGALAITRCSYAAPAAQAVLEHMSLLVQQGRPLHEALQAFPQVFHPTLCKLVAAGEHSGQLGALLARAAANQENRTQLRKRLITALLYPVAIVSASLVLIAVFLWQVVPAFAALYSRNAQALPAPTRIVLQFTEALHQGSTLVLIALLGLAAAFALRLLTTHSQWLLRLPLCGSVVRKAAVAQWADTLAVLLHSGVPLHAALTGISNGQVQDAFAQALHGVHRALARGAPLHQACTHPWFNAQDRQLIALGEHSAQLEKMLHYLAATYQRDIESTLERGSKLLEPLLVLLLGLLIGGLVLALYLPIFELGHLVGG